MGQYYRVISLNATFICWNHIKTVQCCHPSTHKQSCFKKANQFSWSKISFEIVLCEERIWSPGSSNLILGPRCPTQMNKPGNSSNGVELSHVFFFFLGKDSWISSLHATGIVLKHLNMKAPRSGRWMRNSQELWYLWFMSNPISNLGWDFQIP